MRLAEGVFHRGQRPAGTPAGIGRNAKTDGERDRNPVDTGACSSGAGQPAPGLAALERALTLAEPEGYLRTFVDEGEAMRLLISDFRLTIANQAPILCSAMWIKLLAAFPQPAEVTSQSKIANQKSEIIEPLTDRELEILRLIAEGHSNAEISQRLYLALSTVKGHNLRIFNKLQVQNRTEAVVRARELGLL